MALQNISGIAITCNTTGQTGTSDCAGDIRFHNPSGGSQSWSTAAGVGHRCTTGDDEPYSALGPVTRAHGAVELTISPVSQFLLDSLLFSAGSLLTAHSPTIGGTWTAIANNLKSDSTASGVEANNTTVNAVNLVYNTATPPSANYVAEVSFQVISIGNFHKPRLLIHYDHTAGNAYVVQYVSGSSVVQLQRLDAGVVTVLGSVALSGVGNHIMAIAYESGVLHWWVDGSAQSTVSDSTHAAAGLVALGDTVTALPQDAGMFNLSAAGL